MGNFLGWEPQSGTFDKICVWIILKNPVIIGHLLTHDLLHQSQIIDTNFLNFLFFQLVIDSIGLLSHPYRILFNEFVNLLQKFFAGVTLSLTLDSFEYFFMQVGFFALKIKFYRIIQKG